MSEEFDEDFENIPFEKFQELSDEDEDDGTLEALKKSAEPQQKMPTLPVRPPQPPVSSKPVVVEDFIRNYLKKMGMERTLTAFQTEWYENAFDSTTDPVVDAYAQIQELTEQVFRLKEELQAKTEFAEKASGLFEKLRKERDFHKMHHRRVVEEKNKLLRDLKRLVKHNANYEPALREMKSRYESVMKDKMLLKLEKEKYMNRIEVLEETVRQLQSYGGANAALAQSVLASSPLRSENDAGTRILKHTTASLARERENAERYKLPFKEGVGVQPAFTRTQGSASGTARKTAAPPALNVTAKERPSTPPELPPPASKAPAYKVSKTYAGHTLAVTSLTKHPRLEMMVSTSDDMSWRIWSIDTGDMGLQGTQHKEWVSSSSFHPSGHMIATGSGDCTVKLWSFEQTSCAATFTDHTGPVWAVSFMDHGNTLASASSDTTIRLWDTHQKKCKHTLRGHMDSVNDAQFLPYTTTLASCSADKTVSLWDVRMGQPVQTFYGHANVCNRLAIDPMQQSVATTDADGVVFVWDIRTVTHRARFNCGPSPANGISFDGSGKMLAVASDDSTIKIINIDEDWAGQSGTTLTKTSPAFDSYAATMSNLGASTRLPPVTRCLHHHQDQVLDVLFDPSNRYLLSCSADRTIVKWT